MSHSPFIHTYSSGQFHYGDPRKADVRIEDIAHQLSLVCRFSGACKYHYSVAQHSNIVESIVKVHNSSPRVLLRALLHDAHEAYIGDFPTPFQVWFRDEICSGADFLEEAKTKLDNLVFSKLGVNYALTQEEADLIHWADKVSFIAESSQLFKDKPTWLDAYADQFGLIAEDLSVEALNIAPATPAASRNAFLARYHALCREVFEPTGEAA